jgi:hypothetical protein
MTAEPKKKSKSLVLIIAGGLVLLCIVCGVFGAILGSTPEAKATSTARAIERATEAAKPTATPGPTNTPLPTNTPPLPAPPFEEIRSTVAGMTEAQWKAYLPTLEGMVVEQWTGWVAEVNVKGSQYELWVDMDAPDDLLSAQDIYFPIPADIAMQLQKDQKITFSGQIERVSEFLGSISIYLENVTLEGQDAPQITPEAVDTSDGIALSFEEISSKVAGMTEAQWKAYLPTLEDMLVENWTGWVEEVNVVGDKYELWVDMDSPDALFSAQDVYFPIPNDIALELQKDERIIFSGRIKSVTELLGSVSFHLEEVTFQREQ